MFVHNVPFTLQERVRTTKTDKHAFSLLKKDKLDTRQTIVQLFINVLLQSTKNGKKHLCMDNKVQETIGDVYCPTCKNENCVYISINKASSVYDCKKNLVSRFKHSFQGPKTDHYVVWRRWQTMFSRPKEP